MMTEYVEFTKDGVRFGLDGFQRFCKPGIDSRRLGEVVELYSEFRRVVDWGRPERTGFFHTAAVGGVGGCGVHGGSARVVGRIDVVGGDGSGNFGWRYSSGGEREEHDGEVADGNVGATDGDGSRVDEAAGVDDGDGRCGVYGVGVRDGRSDSGDVGLRPDIELRRGAGVAQSDDKVGVGASEVKRGVNYERNKKNREEQRKRKLRRKETGQDWRKGRSEKGGVNCSAGTSGSGSLGFWNSCSSELRQQLIDSKARMHIAENDRVAEKAKRQLAVYSANDVEVEVKRYGTGMRASLERSMVSIEKTHGTLVATGNVPGEFHGSAETVVSASPGSISPNSSVSEAEVRKMQKDLLDCNAVIEKFEKRFGVQAAMLDYIDKDIWTENSENDRILDEFCPDGYAKDTSYTPEGKFRLIV